MLKPKALRPGDKIGIVATSAPGPALYPHRVERGARALERLGYRVELGAHVFGRRGWVSGTSAERVADLHHFLEDTDTRAIMSAIGGDHACELLPLIDADLLLGNPKLLVGHSDFTVLTVGLHAATGLVTFNGPALMTDLAEYEAPFPYTIRAMQKVLGRAEPAGELAPSRAWTDERLDWGKHLDLTRPRDTHPNPGWTWLREGRAEGPLLGGCLESLQHLRGTPWWPDTEGRILYLETSEEKTPPAKVDALLQDLENMNVLPHVAALLWGRPHGYTKDQRARLLEVLRERTAPYDYPVVADMDFGHTAPRLTLPNGVPARIDDDPRTITLLEGAVEA